MSAVGPVAAVLRPVFRAEFYYRGVTGLGRVGFEKVKKRKDERRSAAQVMISMVDRSRPYSALGKLLDAYARQRDVRGPYRIADHLKETAGLYKQAPVLRCLHVSSHRPCPYSW